MRNWIAGEHVEPATGDAADQKPPSPEKRDFVVVRAAQAILYLQGELSKRHQELYRNAKTRAANFLWDDM